MADIEVAFAPTPVGGRRRRLPPAVLALAIVCLLAVAVAKPWAGGSGPTASGAVGLSSASASGSPRASDGSPSAGHPSPAFGVLPEPALGSPRPGTWGVGLAVDAPGDATGGAATWSVWTPLAPLSDRLEPYTPDPGPVGTGCASVPTIAGAASILGFTVPDETTTDVSLVGWWVNGPWVLALDGLLARLDTPGHGRVAELVRADRKPWPEGRYEFRVLTPSHETALAFCLGSAGSASADPGLDQAIVGKIVAQLAPRSGAWGVGTGGNGPRLIRDEPWTDWAAVDPGPAWKGTSLTLWPDTGLCMSAPRLLSHPSLVAVTAPSGLVPDWKVGAWWTDGTRTASLDGVIRQVSPPGNRGITYLERVDHGSWPDGRYEFDVQAGDHRTSLTVCIGAH
ncbi:MAG TPA: hypothetical protein VF323_13235 [Candidatus Limnocylindrales bacterium]